MNKYTGKNNWELWSWLWRFIGWLVLGILSLRNQNLSWNPSIIFLLNKITTIQFWFQTLFGWKKSDEVRVNTINEVKELRKMYPSTMKSKSSYLCWPLVIESNVKDLSQGLISLSVSQKPNVAYLHQRNCYKPLIPVQFLQIFISLVLSFQ